MQYDGAKPDSVSVVLFFIFIFPGVEGRCIGKADIALSVFTSRYAMCVVLSVPRERLLP